MAEIAAPDSDASRAGEASGPVKRAPSSIEFAFVFPTLLLVMLGIIDFGFLFQRYEVVTNAAREGARVAILPGYGNADVQARVNQYLTAGGLTGTATSRSARRKPSTLAANASPCAR